MRKAREAHVSFIRSTVPVTVLFASIGFLCFGVIDMLGGRLFRQFVADPRPATFLSALLGAAIGYGIGWFVVRKFGLPHSATPYDVDAAADRAKQGQQ
ncbi:hypothetical protein [Bradyrhizobium sp. NAS96.2]|uniref:hypothetical protein n=1 Tax=Bradyrhizobium sp. NAS96.2 TaxID=1680160 RepID=UPI00093BD470|nr:hypothetical protein [Bradyrhizobium sp. NAS96.2]OKO67354.1 hypothetical protein AC628_39485 [Bradyrhizobium sp. NAS96.2]